MFMLRQTSVKMAVLLHKQASDRFHSLLTVYTVSENEYDTPKFLFICFCNFEHVPTRILKQMIYHWKALI